MVVDLSYSIFDIISDKGNDEDTTKTTKSKIMKIKSLLDANPLAIHARFGDNQESPLHTACRFGLNVEIVKLLIQSGNPWNAVDLQGKSAGEIAKELDQQEIYEFLVEEGVRSEWILSILERRIENESVENVEDEDENVEDENIENENIEDESFENESVENVENESVENVKEDCSYLDQKLTFTDNDVLVDAENNGVMMGWEKPLMQLHADRLLPCPNDMTVLNVGFGLGIIDTIIQGKSPKLHVIIEAHPDVYAHMQKSGWTDKPGVRVIFGKWQQAVLQLEEEGLDFDAIFFDTFGEYYNDLREFHEHLPNLLSQPHGIYSFFNGLGGTNEFFHDVYCRIAEMDLNEIGLSTEYEEIPVETLGDDTWKDLKRPYFSLKTYRLPTCRFL